MHAKYGQSSHYDATSGEAYFAYQNQHGPITGQLNAWKFEKYIKPTDSVLDFGCGGGWLLRELQASTKFGVEPNPVARECCKRIGINASPTVDELPVNLSFDIIISHHALEHVPYPIEALRALRTKLKPGGCLVFVLPIDDWRVQRDYTGMDIDHHLHTWSPRLFANTLSEAGFQPEKISILTDAWPPKVHFFIRLPKALFKVACYLCSVLLRRRQLLAIARHSPAHTA
jgi:SAM-dependent methyltransferase